MEATVHNPLGVKPVSKLVFSMAVPAVIANLANALYNIVDQIFIGQGVGYLGNAATSVAFPLTTICMALGLMAGLGSAASFNLALGKGDEKKAKQYAGTAVSMLFISGVIICILVQLLLEPLMNAFGATKQTLSYAMAYSRISAFGIPFLLISTGINPLVRADRSATYSMMGVVSGAVLNTILDPLLIFTFDMGIAGAALATVISQMVSAAILLAYFPRFKSVKIEKNDFIPRGFAIKSITTLGLTPFIFQISTMIIQITLNNLLKVHGAASIYGSDIPIAVAGIISKIKAFGTTVMAKVIIVGGMCGIITSWNSFMIGGSRAMYSMAESYMIPKVFAKLHPKHKTPINALILIGVLTMIAPFAGRRMLVWICDAGNFGCCLAYCMVSLSFLILRKKEPDMERPYKVPYFGFVGLMAVLMSGFMVLMYCVPGSGGNLILPEWIMVGSWSLLGAVFYVGCKIKYEDKFGLLVELISDEDAASLMPAAEEKELDLVIDAAIERVLAGVA